MALQLAELYTKSFTEQSKKNKALQEVETAITLFTQYEVQCRLSSSLLFGCLFSFFVLRADIIGELMML